MKKSLLIVLAIFLMAPLVKATHVIGGDIHIQWVSQNNYNLKLRFYRDDINANPAAVIPNSININVYDQVTKALVTSQTLTRTSLGVVPLGDPCYTPDTNVVKIGEGIFDSPTPLFIPDNPNGYYLSAQVNARNALAINVQANGTMTWFAMMPDPALGQNSSPDFGDYPNDAYFCVNSPKIFSYPITDPDGDSLAYSFTEPLNAGSLPGYPYYTTLTWQTFPNVYSLADIIGGSTPMTINPSTGVITANPSLQGFFTFAVRVEEFRDTTQAQNGPKVKIGETRRDIQYQSLNCTSGNPPQFLNTVPTMNQTINIPYNRLYCKDLIFSDMNATDTLFFQAISPIFDSGAVVSPPPPDINGDEHYFYNWNGSTWNDSVVIPPSVFDTSEQAYMNIGTVAQRFCWRPGCTTIGQTYPFQVNAYSLGCDGKSQDSILFNIHVVPPTTTLHNPGNKIAQFGEEFCFDVTWQDTGIVDMMDLVVESPIFAEGAEIPNLDNNFQYNLFGGTVVTGVPNDAPNTTTLGTRVCWTPDCQHIGKTYPIKGYINSVDCPTAGIEDTIDFEIQILPPFDSLGVVPNVITPNGDGHNDTYKIGGVSNPCNDDMKVQIYNRWGLLIYENNTYPEFEWDGKNKSGNVVPAGTYFVLVSGTFGSEVVTLDQRTVTVLDPK